MFDTPITEECKVVKIKKNFAVIELERKPRCESCKACSFNRRNTVRLNARLETECSVGDRVIAQMPERTIKGSALLMFLTPLFFMLIAIILTVKFEWYVQLSSIAGALLLGLGTTIFFDRMLGRNAAYMATVKELAENNNHIGETND